MAERELRTGEAAALIGVDPSTVWRWIEAGLLPAILVGRQRRVRESDARAMRTEIPVNEKAPTGAGTPIGAT